ncbi:oxidoreductase [Pseudonocardia sp.]|uniref:oxidoreductase n=1 Tax=Pseudonocardia sp. TaxID=60912 RepID=UPI00261799DD|nr:oxidoreductase [Pseudonocardia sp.]
MGLLDRLRRNRRGTARAAGREDEAHLREWTAEHEGVEAYVEPRTAVTETTMLLVDKDGQWTRRRIAGPAAARKLARSLTMPVYDVQLMGYPQRMRDHDARQRVLRERRRREELGEP